VHRGQILGRLVVGQILDGEALSRSEVLILLEVDPSWPVFGSTPIFTSVYDDKWQAPSEEILVEDEW